VEDLEVGNVNIVQEVWSVVSTLKEQHFLHGLFFNWFTSCYIHSSNNELVGEIGSLEC
jgi:hypothetical protein